MRLTSVILLLGASLVLAEVYSFVVPAPTNVVYVDYANGNDANDGISAPFKHCPGDLNATSNAAVKVLKPGDTVYFQGGVTYSGRVDANWSGTPGNPITYRSLGTSACLNGGAGVVVDYNARKTGVLSLQAQSNIVVDGLTFQHAPTNENTGSIGWFGSSGGAANITIQNCYITNNFSSGDGYCGIVIQGPWENSTGVASNFTIRNCEITGTGSHSILIRAAIANVTISSNHLHHAGPFTPYFVGDGIFAATGDTTAPTMPDDINIVSNLFHDFPTKGAMIFQGASDVRVLCNKIYSTDCTNNFGIAVAQGTNILIENNYVLGNQNLEGPMRIYSIVSNGSVSNVNIYNNTSVGSGAGLFLYVSATTNVHASVGGVFATNNICWLTNMNVGVANDAYIKLVGIDPSGVLQSDYNIFYGGGVNSFVVTNAHMTFASFTNLIGCDVHSVVTNPLVAVATGIIASNSPAVNAGVAIAGRTTDLYGLPSTNTIGACEPQP